VLTFLIELKFRLPIKRFSRNPVIEPCHLVGSLEECLWSARIPPPEDLISDTTQQDGQQQTGSGAKGGGEGDSHSACLFTQ
jgi:hypothetical protein